MYTNGTPINKHIMHRNRAAGHIYHNDKNKLNMGKNNFKKTQKDW